MLKLKASRGAPEKRDAAQLEKWVAEGIEDGGIAHKEVSVVNVWRRLLNARSPYSRTRRWDTTGVHSIA